MRAHSLLELALWDVKAKAAGLPLHLLLGGLRERIPALAVAGYLLEVRGEDAIVEELIALREQGFGHLKLMIGARDAAWTHRFLGRCRDAVGDTKLSLDVHYSFPSVAEAVEVCRAGGARPRVARGPVPARGLAPSPRAGGGDADPSGRRGRDRRARLRRPAGGGLVPGVRPASCGGLEPALRGLHLAGAAGARVLSHGFPWLGAARRRVRRDRLGRGDRAAGERRSLRRAAGARGLRARRRRRRARPHAGRAPGLGARTEALATARGRYRAGRCRGLELHQIGYVVRDLDAAMDAPRRGVGIGRGRSAATIATRRRARRSAASPAASRCGSRSAR